MVCELVPRVPQCTGEAGVDQWSDNRRFVWWQVAEENRDPQGSPGRSHTAAGGRVAGIKHKGAPVRGSLSQHFQFSAPSYGEAPKH